MNNSNCCMISISNSLKVKHISKEFDVLIENDSFHILINNVLMYYYPVWKYRLLIKHLHKKSFYTLFSINLKFWLRLKNSSSSKNLEIFFSLEVNRQAIFYTLIYQILILFIISICLHQWCKLPGFKEPEWTN